MIQIFGPRYDAGVKTLTYDARILPDYNGDGLTVFTGRQTGTVPASFDDQPVHR